jgi:thioredoxin 2
MNGSAKLCCTACGQMNRVPADRLAAGPKCGTCGAALLDGRVAELGLQAHDKAVRGDDVPLVVDYWAPWCGPCRQMAPEFARAARSLAPGVRFAKLNTEDFPEVSQRLNIRGIPALILYHRGREVARLAGARPAAEIAAFVERSLAPARG